MSNNPFSDPYQPPQYTAYPGPAPNLYPPGQTPAVWTWYVVYCIAMALLYFLCLALGLFFLAMPEEMLEGEDSPAVIRVQGAFLVVLGLALGLLYAAAPFLPRAKWAWIYGFVTIGIGLTSCCTLPFSILLLVQWIKPEVKAFFNAT